jgi:hypothetical protein
MSHERLEKRECVRFEIPGATVCIRKAGLTGRLFGFSKPLDLMNLSKGGVGFESDTLLKMDQKILLQLHVQGEPLLHLRGTVRWQASTSNSKKRMMTGVQFLPFGGSSRANSRQVLEVLHRLEEKYAQEALSRFPPKASGKELPEIKIDELF